MEEQEKIRPLGRFKLHKGHKVFKCNVGEKELSVMVIDPHKGGNVMVDKECVYFSALNVKSAKRKIRRVFKIEVEFKK